MVQGEDRQTGFLSILCSNHMGNDTGGSVSSLLGILCLCSEAVDEGLAHPMAQCEDRASSCVAGNLQTPRQVINVDCNYLLSIISICALRPGVC